VADVPGQDVAVDGRNVCGRRDTRDLSLKRHVLPERLNVLHRRSRLNAELWGDPTQPDDREAIKRHMQETDQAISLLIEGALTLCASLLN